MNRTKVKAAVFICVLVLFYGLWAKSVSHIPIGTYWWDFLVFDGISEAISQGLLPARDFWSPLLLPAYLFRFANLLDNDGSVYLLLHLLQWVIIFPIALVIVPRRTSTLEFILVMSAVTIFALAPFNYSTWGGETNGNISYNGFYNRFGDLLLILTILFLIPPKGSRNRADPVAMGIILSMAFVTKMSLFAILAGIVTVHLVRDRSRYDRIDLTVLFAPGIVVAGFIHLYLAPDYMSFVLGAGGMRLAELFTMTALRLPDFFALHFLEIMAVLMGSVIIASLEWTHRDVAGPVFSRSSDLFVLSVLATVAFTLTNYGDLGLLPVSAGFLVYFKVTDREQGRATTRGSTGADHVKNHLAGRAWRMLMTRQTLLALGIFVVLIYLYNIGFNVYDIGKHQIAGNFVDIGVGNDYVSRRFTVHSWHLRTMSGREDILESKTPINADIRDFVFWVHEATRASEFLKSMGIGNDRKVFALTFPTYVFSRLSDFSVPEGTYPWLLVDHNLTVDDRDVSIVSMLDGAEIVMEDKCNLHRASRLALPEIFRDRLQSDFTPIQISPCWDAHFRK